MLTKILVMLVYIGIIAYLGYKGWKETTQAKDYMVAGRKMHPFIMAFSYGATFISTSAIIGFGGAAGMFGFPLLWLTVANIFLGIFIAMVFFGKRTRRMGVALQSLTFPELLGRRYRSGFLQGFAGIVIFLFIPVYSAAVLIGISRIIEISLHIPYNTVLILVTLILTAYVITGGLKAVMYTDAFQGCIMFVMMLILLVYTYSALGGILEAHQTLTDMAPLMPEKLQKGGMLGWTQGAVFASPLWLVIYTTIVYGVGVGVLAQPQLAVRFMTVASDKSLNRAVLFGGVFILFMTGAAFVIGALSNAVFYEHFEKISIAMAQGNIDKIIPVYIEKIMPSWFAALFLVAMFAAAMSTLSSQYHVGGTSLGRDLFEKGLRISSRQKSITLTRAGVFLTIVATLIWAWLLPASIIARATAFFFGLCAASFLPAFTCGLYWKGTTKAGAITSMLGGFFISMFCLLFIHEKEAAAIGLSKYLFNQDTLVSGAEPGSWIWLLQWVDPNVIALPVSFALIFAVSLFTRTYDREHIDYCWSNFPQSG
ncbi:MAG: sodium:solute symporter family protein [Thermodesulfobacteriota bacterium]